MRAGPNVERPVGRSRLERDAAASPTPEPTASPTSTPIPTPTPAPPFSATDWGRLAVPAFADRYGTTSMAAVAALGDTVVAVGRDPRGAAAWSVGPDGTWRRAPAIPSFEGGKMADVVATSSGFVAVGQHGIEAAAWTSTDGASWTPATVQAAGADPNSEFGSLMQHVTVGPEGLVAVGPGKASETGPAEWSSADGQTWTIVSDPVQGVGAASDIGLMPDGRFVIVGSPTDETGATEAWSSTDGRTWTALPGMTGMWVRAVAPWRGGIVVVGSVSDENAGVEVPAIWVMAPDGRWERVKDVPGSTHDRDVYISAVAATSDRLIATGASPKGDVGIWVSDDGTTWRLVDSPGLEGPEGEFEPRDIVVAGSQRVVVGEFPNEDSSFTWSAAVWTNPAPAQPAPTTPIAVVHPCPSGAPALVDVAVMTPDERLACFGGTDLTLRGYLGTYSDPGLIAYPPTPGWIADDTTCCRPFMPLAGMPQDIVYLPVAFDPSKQRGLNLPDGTAVEVTGHFDDARAKSCRGGGAKTRDDIEACRRQFVVTAYKKISQP